MKNGKRNMRQIIKENIELNNSDIGEPIVLANGLSKLINQSFSGSLQSQEGNQTKKVRSQGSSGKY